MKNMKKLFSLALALVMMMALVVTAGATGTEPEPSETTPVATPPTTGSITITNAAKGETYEIFKLFDAEVKAGGVVGDKGITYTYAGDTLPKSEEGVEPAWNLGDYFEIITTGEGVGQVRMKGNATTLSDDAVNALKAWAATQTATSENTKVAEGGEVVFSGIPLGYYVITSTVGSGTAISVDSTTPDPEVVDKNDSTPSYPTDGTGKVSEGKTFAVGEDVPYTLTLNTVNWVTTTKDDGTKETKQVLSYTLEDTYTATDTDGNAITDALGTPSIISVKILNGRFQENSTTEKVDVTLTEDATTDGYTVDENGNIVITWAANTESLYLNGAQIEVKYTAKVLKSGTITNKFNAKYNDGSDKEVPGTDPEAPVYSSNVVIDKFTGGNAETGESGTVLAGAKFVLKNSNDANAKYYKIENGTVSWVDSYDVDDDADTVVFTTDNNGATTFVGLKDGTYYLEEVVAPDGYNKLDGTKTVVVNAANSDTHVVSYTSHVQNNTGTELPSTGGIGTTIFYVVGGALMIGAAVLFLTKKRSEV